MRKKMNYILTTVMIQTVLGLASPLHAEDVYNFYFQKGQAPDKVIQGGNAQQTLSPAEQPATPSTPAPSATTIAKTAPPTTAEKKFNKWTIGLGKLTSFSANQTYYSKQGVYDSSGDRIATIDSRVGQFSGENKASIITGEYHWNKYISAFAQLTFEGPIEGALGVVVTPIRYNVFGHDLFELGVVAGTATAHLTDTSLNTTRSLRNTFLGAKLKLNITDQFGIETISASLTDTNANSEMTRTTVAATYNF